MQLVDTVVRTAPTGALEVRFVGEGGESIEVTMADASFDSEDEAVAKAKAMLVQVATFGAPAGENRGAETGPDERAVPDETPVAAPRAPF